MLEAMNLAPETMDGSFRISLSRHTSPEELQTLVQVITQDIIPRIK